MAMSGTGCRNQPMCPSSLSCSASARATTSTSCASAPRVFSPAIVILDRCTPSPCVASGTIWNNDWVATAGDYAFEPPGETHTLVVPEEVQEMATLFHVTGGYTYVDPYGKALGYEDVFTKLENVRRHYERIGLGADYANRFVR